ncbi:hypothetical protein GDO78_017184 [Eleutherodactylus coqui]|uniref:Uncharacterized protein n=1 Tax=Eleutherodactylus coqui TaxID=57060 RepID=A0A8J6EJU6_ELECQ|nr:hypothetical protein GDO78_017184 [Eleutherodactylus coqui]
MELWVLFSAPLYSHCLQQSRPICPGPWVSITYKSELPVSLRSHKPLLLFSMFGDSSMLFNGARPMSRFFPFFLAVLDPWSSPKIWITPFSSMCIFTSVAELTASERVLVRAEGRPTKLFLHCLGNWHKVDAPKN